MSERKDRETIRTQRDPDRVQMAGILEDEGASSAPHNLITPQEFPPIDAEVFERHFELIEDRELRLAMKAGKGRDTSKPVAIEEKVPDRNAPRDMEQDSVR